MFGAFFVKNKTATTGKAQLHIVRCIYKYTSVHTIVASLCGHCEVFSEDVRLVFHNPLSLHCELSRSHLRYATGVARVYRDAPCDSHG